MAAAVKQGSSKANSGTPRLQRVCETCARRKVTCDLGRPTCGACVRYARAHPDNRCVYAENATQVPARRRSPETTVPAAGALELPRTRSGARRLQAALRETAEAAPAPIIPSEVETPPLEVRDEEDADPAAEDLMERMADATLSRIPAAPALPHYDIRSAPLVHEPFAAPLPYGLAPEEPFAPSPAQAGFVPDLGLAADPHGVPLLQPMAAREGQTTNPYPLLPWALPLSASPTPDLTFLPPHLPGPATVPPPWVISEPQRYADVSAHTLTSANERDEEDQDAGQGAVWTESLARGGGSRASWP
ncbi:hypothetical protein JCM8202v2_000150 [Rhodotorula sphaerocarpa]